MSQSEETLSLVAEGNEDDTQDYEDGCLLEQPKLNLDDSLIEEALTTATGVEVSLISEEFSSP